MEKYDLIVIGSGPAGEKAAVKAAYFKKRVALIEKASAPGGSAVHEALPSKVLKEIALHSSGRMENELYGLEKTFHTPSIALFLRRATRLSDSESQEIKKNLNDHGVDYYQGEASFESPHEIVVSGRKPQKIYGDYILIATGSSPSTAFNSGDVDGLRVHNVQTILDLERYPKSLCILGSGISGCEYGSTFSLMDIKVYIVNRSRTVLPAFDQSIMKFFVREMERSGVKMLYEQELLSIDVPDNEEELIKLTFKDGSILDVDMALYAYGRVSNTKMLKLENAGVIYDENTGIPTDQVYRSNIHHIYAIGDVNGQIRLANIAMDQGRVAVAEMFDVEGIRWVSDSIPYGIYSIPEVAMVGMTEEMMQKRGVDYDVGIAYYGDTARGKFLGSDGVIKLLFTKHDQIIHGVHIVGSGATELIHYGVGLVRDKKTLMFMISEPFNFPTLHEIYKYAAYDGLGALTGYKLKKHRTRFEL